MKILIVDDDVISSTLMSRILQNGGYQPIVAPGATKALEYLEAGEGIMVVILDLMMPDMNGLDFLELIRKRPGLSCIPVIICSGDRFRESVVRSAKMGISDYLLKPIDGTVLLEKIGDALRTLGPPLVDKDRIMGRLKIELDAYEEMLNTLIQNTSAVLEEAPALVRDNKIDDLRFLLERLRGGASSLGAQHLSSVLYKITDHLQRGDTVNAHDILLALQREFNILCNEVKGGSSILTPLERDALEKIS